MKKWKDELIFITAMIVFLVLYMILIIFFMCLGYEYLV